MTNIMRRKHVRKELESSKSEERNCSLFLKSDSARNQDQKLTDEGYKKEEENDKIKSNQKLFMGYSKYDKNIFLLTPNE